MHLSCQLIPFPPAVLASSGGHQNAYCLQADGTHPTGMLSCLLNPPSFLCIYGQLSFVITFVW